jgi:ribosomal protein S8
MEYYIYVYFDTRKTGYYKFDDYIFEYEPIYIGKGIKNRIKRHLTLCKNSKTHFHNKLAQIINDGFEPKYEILKGNVTESEALNEEIRLIKLIGREKDGGTLTNLTDGGEGQSGLIHKEESKLKTSNSLKNNKKFQEYMKTEEYSNKISNSLLGHEGYGKGIPRTEEVKNKIRETLKGRPGRKHTKESKEKMSKNNSGKYNPNSKLYIVETDKGIIKFETRKELKVYLDNFNLKNGLNGPNKISLEGILYKGVSKNFKLIGKS